MVAPAWTEVERLAALRRYDILDTPPEPEFDDAVALVKAICDVPVALVSLVHDCRQWFKAKIGVDTTETDLDTSVCALAIQQSDLFVIEDLLADPRTKTMSLVTNAPHIRFYAGMPLVTSEGFPLGSLCAIDVQPRPGGLTAQQRLALKALGRQVVTQIELRSAVGTRDRAIVEQERRQEQATQDSAILTTLLHAQQNVRKAGGDFDAALTAMVESTLAAIHPADGVVVGMREADHLVYRTVAGTAIGFIGYRMPIAGSFSGRACREERAVISADVATDDRGNADVVSGLNIRSLVAVPLARHGKVFGVLTVHSAVANAFTYRHVLIIHMIAGLIAASFAESAEAAALQAAAETKQNYRHIVDSAMDSALISTDAVGAITSWSRGAQTIMGWTEQEMLGQPIDRIFTPEDCAVGRPQKELATAEAQGRASDKRWHLRNDGSRFYAHGAVTPLLGVSQKGFVKSLRDVTEEHETKTAFEQSRLRLETALETGLIAFFHWNVTANTVSGDSRFAEFFDLDRRAAEHGVSIDDVLRSVAAGDRDAVNAAVSVQVDHCDDFSQAYRTQQRDGRIRWLRVRGRCIEQDRGRPLVYVGTAVDVTQQREAEERLRFSGDRLELATRAAQLGSFDYQPQSGMLDWDDRCRELFGLSPGAPVTYEAAFLAGLHPEDREAAASAVSDALDPAGVGTFDIEYRTIGIEDGIERAILAKGMASFAGGVPVRLIGTVQDITADRVARALLLETEERFRLAIRATNDAIWDWDLRSNQITWNKALETGYGHAPTILNATRAWWLDHIHPEDRDRIVAGLQAVIDSDETDWTDEYRFKRSNGQYADIRDRGYVIRDAHGDAVRMLGAFLDQTDRKQLERNLKSRNETLEETVIAHAKQVQRLWETSPDLLLMLGFDGIIQRVNPAWTAILGYQPEELLGQHIMSFVHPDDTAITTHALRDVACGALPTVENRYLHKDGTVRWFAWVAAPTGSEIFATGRHMTDQKAAEIALRSTEEQLRQAQKVEAIGQLTGGVAHDFNNLLTVIRGAADLLRRPNLPPERQSRYIDAIANTAERATKLTSQLLAFARRSTLKPETFDAGASIRGLAEMLQTLTGSMIRIDIRIENDHCTVNADPSQFDTAIVNMAVNARDAMNRQGDLSITIKSLHEMPAIRLHPSVPGDFVAVAIADTGGGIAPDKVEHIFEPFFTTKPVGEGTGLGLSQVFGFAKQSGGEIAVTSEIGVGTIFTLYLPRVPAIGGFIGQNQTVAERAGKTVRILVVEDNVEVGDFAIQALEQLGHSTVLAISADDALSKLALPEASFDIVFSDVMMPGMNGIALGNEIRQTYPDLPILLTSGFSSAVAADGTHGFNLLQKPYSVDELAEAIQQNVGVRRSPE